MREPYSFSLSLVEHLVLKLKESCTIKSYQIVNCYWNFYIYRDNLDLEDMQRKEIGDLKIKLQVSKVHFATLIWSFKTGGL